MRRVCIITGTRAEWGLLYWLAKGVKESRNLQLQIIATGMHLSSEFGLTWRAIEKDGFAIDRKIEMLLSSDSSVAISKSIALGIIGFSDALEHLSPDIIIILGDRYESFAAAAAATSARIPIAHLHGGEATEGLIDEAFRHAITKMSHLHFTAAEPYRTRVIQLGEDPHRVFNVGGLGLDNISKMQLMDRKEFEDSIGFQLGQRNLLVTFHPITLEENASSMQFQNLLNALDSLHDTHIIFTKPNADSEGRKLIERIDSYVENRAHAVSFISLGQRRYLSAMRHVDAVVGNSSSGIIEAPSFKIGTINIGDRQKGRLKCDSIIDCDADKGDIVKAIEKLYTYEFQSQLPHIINPYGTGGAAEKIIPILETVSLEGILKKRFYNLPTS